MAEIGIRELRERASDILRRVREQGESFAITYRGRIVARLVPAAPERRRGEAATVWADMDELAQEIAGCWPEGVSSQEAVLEQRR